MQRIFKMFRMGIFDFVIIDWAIAGLRRGLVFLMRVAVMLLVAWSAVFMAMLF